MAAAALEVEGLCRRFGGLRAVDNLGLRVDAGHVLGLLGPNGSGKTTALNLISGVLKPDAGTVRLDGSDVAGLAAHRLARRGIARTFQLVKVFRQMTARENIVAGLAFAGPRWFGAQAEGRVEQLLVEVGLSGRADTRAGNFNYIDQKRLELARALAADPKVLLLDEWLAGLNPTELAQAVGLVQRVRDRGVAIVMVEHVLEAVRALCDHCVVMNAGTQIATGTPAEVLSHPAVVTAYLGGDGA